MSELYVYSVEKILFVTNDFPPQSGGIETFIEGLIRQSPRGSVVVHASTRGDIELQENYDRQIFDELEVIVVRDRQRILLPTPGLLTRVAGTLHAHSIKSVVFGASVPLGLLAPALRKRGVQKMVAITHGHEVWWSKLPLFSHMLRAVGRNVDHLTYLGSFTERAISRALDQSDRKKLTHLPPGVDIDRFHPGPKVHQILERYGLANKSLILSVGRLVQRKGHDVLIEAMALIREKHPHAHLVIAGAGNYRKKLEKLAKESRANSAITFLGRTPYDELPDLFRSADIFASPTRERFGGLEVEGLGIVFLEASASGLPVIAGDSGGSRDAVQEGRRALVVDGRGVQEVARALDQLLSNPTHAQEMGARGRDWMETQWSWQVIGQRFRALLELN